jgi:hypothetical protein
MKTYVGVDVKIHAFLTSALVGGEWSTPRTGCFTLGENSPPYILDRRLDGLQERLIMTQISDALPYIFSTRRDSEHFNFSDPRFRKTSMFVTVNI